MHDVYRRDEREAAVQSRVLIGQLRVDQVKRLRNRQVDVPLKAVDGEHPERRHVGLLADIASAGWLGGVTGEVDSLGPLLANGLHDIPRYCGHGTFIAGVARCEAPESTVYVANDYINGGLQEWKVVQQLQALIASQEPQVVNLSAGSYTRNDWMPLSFSVFDNGGVTLVCAAGNDATHRKFWPAAFEWAVAVGALGADQRNRAWFSNYGDWVDVYTLGEGLVNAFATGEYTYHEPPKRPATQVFDGRARWSGTSFATPLAAGLIAAEMSQAGLTASDATQAVLARARSQAVPASARSSTPADDRLSSRLITRWPGRMPHPGSGRGGLVPAQASRKGLLRSHSTD